MGINTALSNLQKQIDANKVYSGDGYSIRRTPAGTTLSISAKSKSSSDHPFKLYVNTSVVNGNTVYKLSVTAGTVNNIYPKIGTDYLWKTPAPTLDLTLPTTGNLKNVWLKISITAGVVTSGEIVVSDTNPTDTSSLAHVLLGYYDSTGAAYNNIRASLGYVPTVTIFPSPTTPFVHTFFSV